METHCAQILRFLLASLRDVNVAETLTQECFLEAHRNWSTFRGESSPLTWLIRTAINQQRDYWRHRRMRFWRQTYANSVDMNEASEQLPSGERSPEQRVLAREWVGQLWKAVDSLSDRQRTALFLRYAEELECREIARTTGLRESSEVAHLSRAVAKVRLQWTTRQRGLRVRIKTNLRSIESGTWCGVEEHTNLGQSEFHKLTHEHRARNCASPAASVSHMRLSKSRSLSGASTGESCS